tara:strand:- start:15613 stop:16875 length:1263 start_codon:yes stop_codon:yes gene_type:complete
MEAIETNVEEEVLEETDSLAEGYKTKADLVDEIQGLVNDLNRSDLVQAHKILTTPPEQDVQEDDDSEEVEESKITSKIAKSVVEKLDKKSIMSAYGDMKDKEEVEETDDDDDYYESHSLIIKEIKGIITSEDKDISAKIAERAAKSFVKENKKQIDKLVKEVSTTKKTIKSSFDPKLSWDDSDKTEVSEHVDALLQGEELSEEFKTKTVTIFESAVKSRVEKELVSIREQFDDQVSEVETELTEKVTNQVDEYLNYVAEQWFEENKLAIDTGIRSDLSEEFIQGLKVLFEEHYIEIPEDKVDVLDEMVGKIDELENQLNSEIEKNISLKKELSINERNKLIDAVVTDLADTQVEKFKEITETLDFDGDVESFQSQLSTLKESYFPKQIKQERESDKQLPEGDTTDAMSRYTTALSRTVQK